MKQSLFVTLGFACLLAAPALRAEDPLKVDPKHYSLEFENDSVRVLRIKYGPGEKSVMHTHPEAVVIYLTDAQTKMSFPDGKTQVNSGKAGSVLATPAGDHLPENTGSKPMELILVELKKPTAK